MERESQRVARERPQRQAAQRAVSNYLAPIYQNPEYNEEEALRKALRVSLKEASTNNSIAEESTSEEEDDDESTLSSGEESASSESSATTEMVPPPRKSNGHQHQQQQQQQNGHSSTTNGRGAVSHRGRGRGRPPGTDKEKMNLKMNLKMNGKIADGKINGRANVSTVPKWEIEAQAARLKSRCARKYASNDHSGPPQSRRALNSELHKERERLERELENVSLFDVAMDTRDFIRFMIHTDPDDLFDREKKIYVPWPRTMTAEALTAKALEDFPAVQAMEKAVLDPDSWTPEEAGLGEEDESSNQRTEKYENKDECDEEDEEEQVEDEEEDEEVVQSDSESDQEEVELVDEEDEENEPEVADEEESDNEEEEENGHSESEPDEPRSRRRKKRNQQRVNATPSSLKKSTKRNQSPGATASAYPSKKYKSKATPAAAVGVAAIRPRSHRNSKPTSLVDSHNGPLLGMSDEEEQQICFEKKLLYKGPTTATNGGGKVHGNTNGSAVSTRKSGATTQPTTSGASKRVSRKSSATSSTNGHRKAAISEREDVHKRANELYASKRSRMMEAERRLSQRLDDSSDEQASEDDDDSDAQSGSSSSDDPNDEADISLVTAKLRNINVQRRKAKSAAQQRAAQKLEHLHHTRSGDRKTRKSQQDHAQRRREALAFHGQFDGTNGTKASLTAASPSQPLEGHA